MYVYPALYALGVWWFSTGLILYLDSLPRHTFRYSLAGGTAVFAVAIYRFAASAGDTTIAGAYASFTYGVLAWGWLEMSFFMGWITGPRRSGSSAVPGSLRLFWHGLQACLFHELAILATLAVVLAVTWNAADTVGRWTFVMLLVLRQSAKLNVFLGVRNLGEELLPAHLTYLRSYMRNRPMNLLFPISVTAATVMAVILVQQAGASALPAHAAGLTFLTTMLVLGILEHWFLVLPLPLTPLWSWLLDRRRAAARARPASQLTRSAPDPVLPLR
jgi:putative photosynthetic complex assembly protein 2